MNQMKMTNSDWRYSDARMALRDQVFRMLKEYLPEYPQAVYEFSDTYVSQGNPDASLVVDQFKSYLAAINTRSISEQQRGKLEQTDSE
jgi:hypothetical protein